MNILKNHSYKKLSGRFDLILTSPPYNIGSKSPKKLTNRKFGGYDSKSWGAIEGYSDNLPENIYQNEQVEFLNWCSEHINENGVIAYNHKDRHRNGTLICPELWIFKSGLNLYDKIIWDRKSTHNHNTKYVYQHHEYIYILGKKPYFKNEGLGSVWQISKAPQIGHCAPFPLELARRLIRLYCPKNGIVCDPYSGSGTTMIAAHMENRKFVGAELSKKYYNLSKKRFNDYLHMQSVQQ